MDKLIFILFVICIRLCYTKPLTTTQRSMLWHGDLTRNLGLISDVLSSATTTSSRAIVSTTKPTTSIMSTTIPTIKEIYAIHCHICGTPFKMVGDLKSHLVEQHHADPTVINNAPGKFYIYLVGFFILSVL